MSKVRQDQFEVQVGPNGMEDEALFTYIIDKEHFFIDVNKKHIDYILYEIDVLDDGLRVFQTEE